MPVRRTRRGTLIALVCVGLLAALAWYLTHRSAAGAGGQGGSGRPGGSSARGGGGGGGGSGRGVSTVGVATARRADIPVLIEALGTVTPVAIVVVQAQVAGVLTRVLYREGQTVRQGEVLATIDPRPFETALASAQATRQRDEAQLQAAQVTLGRYQTLLSQDSIARQDVDTQAALVKQLEGTVGIDRAAEAAARLNLGFTRIVAPVTGRVGLRPIDAGNYITNGTTGGVATITQVAPIDVAFAIPQERVPEVQARVGAGAQLVVTAWDSTRTVRLDQGRFLTLDNAVDVSTGTVRAKARFTNTAGNLFPNQFVNVSLLLRTIDGAVVVPVTAMRHGPDGDFVYVVNKRSPADGAAAPSARGDHGAAAPLALSDRGAAASSAHGDRGAVAPSPAGGDRPHHRASAAAGGASAVPFGETVEMRPVTRGEAGVDNVVVTTGLAPGEQVVTEGGDRLKDGAMVKTAAERPDAAASEVDASSGGASGPHGMRDNQGDSARRGAGAGRRGAARAASAPVGSTARAN